MTLNKVVTQVPVEHACRNHSETLQLSSWRERKKQRNDTYKSGPWCTFLHLLLRPFFTFGHQSCVQCKMRFLPLCWFIAGMMCPVTIVIHQYFSISVSCSILRKPNFRAASISFVSIVSIFLCSVANILES